MHNTPMVFNTAQIFNEHELKIKLYKDMVYRFTENKIRMENDGSIYFVNQPFLYLPWSKRNTAFTDIEKQYIENNYINKAEGNLFYFLNSSMRWYSALKNVRQFYKVLSIEEILEAQREKEV